EYHEIPDGDLGHAIADGVDAAGAFVAEQERKVVGDRAISVVQVGAAYPAGGDVHHHLTGSRVGYHDRGRLDGFPRRPGDDTSGLVRLGTPFWSVAAARTEGGLAPPTATPAARVRIRYRLPMYRRFDPGMVCRHLVETWDLVKGHG